MKGFGCLNHSSLGKGEIVKNKVDFVHFSLDDVNLCFKNLSQSYTSLFKEPLFNYLKSLHDKYGAKFSLYTYNDVLSGVPNRYIAEFQASKDWLKIGFHSNTIGHSLATSTYEEGFSYWNLFVDSVIRITGSTESIDRIPRLEYFAGSENALLGMRDANYGALGFLSSDDSRLSYYFDNKKMDYLYNNDYCFDENDLLFLSTDIRCDWFYDNFTSVNSYKKPRMKKIYDELKYRYTSKDYEKGLSSLIIFTHEWLIYDGIKCNKKIECIVDTCRFAYKNNIVFDYAQNRTFK